MARRIRDSLKKVEGRHPDVKDQRSLFKPKELMLARVRTPEQLKRFAEEAIQLAKYARESIGANPRPVNVYGRNLTLKQVRMAEHWFARQIAVIQKFLKSPTTSENIEAKESFLEHRMTRIKAKMGTLKIPQKTSLTST